VKGYDPAAEVYTAWDLGIGDSTAIWFAQTIGREVRIIDFYENSGVGMAGNATGTPDFVDVATDNIRLSAADTLAFNKFLDSVLVSTTDCDGLPAQVGAYMDIGALERQ
jgi:hypothetical protein